MNAGDKVYYTGKGNHVIKVGDHVIPLGSIAEVVQVIGPWITVKWGPNLVDPVLYYADRFEPWTQHEVRD